MKEVNNTPYIIDTTLRDGEQAPGVAFSRHEKLEISRFLDELGIDEIEAGIPAMGSDIIETIRRISRLGLKSRISVWSRALKSDIEHAVLTEAEGIHIAFPVSNIQLSAMERDWSWIEDSVPEITEYAKKYFRFVSIGAQDASRCSQKQLFDFLKIVSSCPINRIRIADTAGVLTPLKTIELMTAVRQKFSSFAFDFHAHNDLGMATANAVTAIQSGIDSVSVTVNGVGERAGNAALEEVIMALSILNDTTKYRIASLNKLCQFVSETSGREIPKGKAVCGDLAFSHESGIHAKASLVNPLAFQAFDGTIVGRESSRNVFGKHSGIGALCSLMEQYHIELTKSQLIELKRKVAAQSQWEKRSLSDEEIMKNFLPLLKK